VDWVVTAVGLVGFVLAGRLVWWAWWLNVANQFLWAAFALTTGQHGFLVGTAFYLVVFTRNAVRWTRERPQAPRDPAEVAKEVLAAEADWLYAAHENSARTGIPNDVRYGFALAAGWVRRHGEHGPPTSRLRTPL
jgi:hypothetical protein